MKKITELITFARRTEPYTFWALVLFTLAYIVASFCGYHSLVYTGILALVHTAWWTGNRGHMKRLWALEKKHDMELIDFAEWTSKVKAERKSIAPVTEQDLLRYRQFRKGA